MKNTASTLMGWLIIAVMALVSANEMWGPGYVERPGPCGPGDELHSYCDGHQKFEVH